MENVFVLIIVFILLMMAFVFVVRVQITGQKEKQRSLKELELIKKAQVLNFFPELQCSDNNNMDPDCYDLYKIMAFKNRMNDDAYYRYYRFLLGNVRISVHRYDPSPNTDKWFKPVVIYDNPFSSSEDILPIRFPVLLRNVTEDRDYFGYVYIGVYSS